MGVRWCAMVKRREANISCPLFEHPGVKFCEKTLVLRYETFNGTVVKMQLAGNEKIHSMPCGKKRLNTLWHLKQSACEDRNALPRSSAHPVDSAGG